MHAVFSLLKHQLALSHLKNLLRHHNSSKQLYVFYLATRADWCCNQSNKHFKPPCNHILTRPPKATRWKTVHCSAVILLLMFQRDIETLIRNNLYQLMCRNLSQLRNATNPARAGRRLS